MFSIFYENYSLMHLKICVSIIYPCGPYSIAFSHSLVKKTQLTNRKSV